MVREKRSKKALRAALVALDGAAQGRPLAVALSEAMAAEGKLGPGERRAAVQTSRAVVRTLRQLDAVLTPAIAAAGLKLKAITREDRSMLRYLALRVSAERDEPRAVLAELALPGPRRPRSLDDRALTTIAAGLVPLEALQLPSEPIAALSIEANVPDFLTRRLVADLGLERTRATLLALNRDARFDLRANRLLVDRDALAQQLAAAGVDARPTPFAPDGLVAADRAHLFGPLHDKGLYELQDEGSQLLVLLTGAKPGEAVVDFCAGSGGKTLALAAMVGREGRVFACDAVAHRLAELPARARRAKAARVVQVSGEAPPDGLLADAVLVDAPCSGIGSLRREPDLRWRTSPEKLDAFPPLQLQILKRAATFVRPGGRLVYATCSPLRAEDEAVVEAFLEGGGFSLVPPEGVDPRLRPVSEGGYLRTWPQTHDTGAFFGAVLVREGTDG